MGAPRKARPRPMAQGSRKKEATIAAATDGLDDKERLFVYHYLITLDAQHAALLAGYSPSVSKTVAYRWVGTAEGNQTKPRVYHAIQRAMSLHLNKLEITADRVLQGLAELAFSNALDFGDVDENGAFKVNLSKATRAQFAAVQELAVHQRQGPAPKKGEKRITETTTKIKLAEKRPALVDLGRHLGVFKDDGAAAQTVHLIIKGAE